MKRLKELFTTYSCKLPNNSILLLGGTCNIGICN